MLTIVLLKQLVCEKAYNLNSELLLLYDLFCRRKV